MLSSCLQRGISGATTTISSRLVLSIRVEQLGGFQVEGRKTFADVRERGQQAATKRLFQFDVMLVVLEQTAVQIDLEKTGSNV